MATVALLIAILAIIVAGLSVILRKPGPQGPKGDRGIPGEDGHDGLDGRDPKFKLDSGHLFITYVESPEDSQWIDLGNIQGPAGPRGRSGKNGKDGKDGKDAVVIDGTPLTKEQVINLLSQGDEIVFPKKLVAPAFHQETRK